MDEHQFDALARALFHSRRSVAGGLLALAAGGIGLLDSDAKGKRKNKKKRKKRKKPGDVCSEADGACGDPIVPCGPQYCSGCCREDNTCVSLFGISDRDCGFLGGACLDCGDAEHVASDQTHCCGAGGDCYQCCTDAHCAGHAEGSRCCNKRCQECCDDAACPGGACCYGMCIAASDCCCLPGDQCVLPWQGQPQDRHCCLKTLACVGSQTGCCSPGTTCVPRVNPPEGTPTHACVTS